MHSSWVCIDANLVLRLVTDSQDESVWRLWEQWDAERRQFAAPALVYYEVTNVLYRYQKQGLISVSSVRLALKAALSLPIRLHSEGDLHWQALDMAERFSLPAAYDAHYLALAERLGAEFWTTDGRLVQAVAPALSWVHLVE